jgi:LmbE family N-acetylglucosaminyl deacetylase
MMRSGANLEIGALVGGSFAVVVAHPDDECLWLSSVLNSATRIVLAFGEPFGRPDIGAARQRAVAQLDLPGLVDLAIPESGSRLAVDLSRPRLTVTGIALTDAAAASRYDANFARLVTALRPLLAGYGVVFTHNPWGEYGHPEHIQLYRAVVSLQAELGYMIGYSNYVDRRSWPLAQEIGRLPCWTQRSELATNQALARRLMTVYRRHGVWTWTNWHRWPRRETIYLQPPMSPVEDFHTLAGEQLLDVAGLRWWPPPWRRAARTVA